MGIQLYPGTNNPRSVHSTVVTHLVRSYRDAPGYTVERSFTSFPGRNVPDVTVHRDGKLLHLFKVVPPGPVTAEQVLGCWRPLAHWSTALGATFWVLVPEAVRSFAEALAREHDIDLRLGGYRVDRDGHSVELVW